MKRFEDRYFFDVYVKDKWVVCPKCGKGAKVTTKKHYPTEEDVNRETLYHFETAVVRCSHCGFEQLSRAKKSFVATIKLNCPNCGLPIFKEIINVKHKLEEMAVNCTNPKCKHTLKVKPSYQLQYNPDYYSKQQGGLKRDRIFGLPYYFQTNIKGNLFWALNPEHIKVMADYVASDLRERKGMSLVAKLPTFIKIKKNRGIILKTLQQWEKNI
nr:hypothetical protein [uncultured Capnocytophaga sp.]